MPTSTEKIAAGLTKAQRQPPAKLTAIARAPSSVAELRAVAEASARKSQRLAEIADSIGAGMDQFEKAKAHELKSLGQHVDERGVVTNLVEPAALKRMLKKEVEAERECRLEATASERQQLRADLAHARETTAAVAHLFTDAVAVLKAQTMASPTRAAYAANLASSGRIEVEQALERAVLTKDTDLAAAALSRMETLPKAQREAIRVDREEVANAIVGADVLRARWALTLTELHAEDGELAALRAEGRTVPSTRKLALGTKRQEFAALNEAVEALPKSDQKTGPEPTPAPEQVNRWRWYEPTDADRKHARTVYGMNWSYFTEVPAGRSYINDRLAEAAS